jgi:arginyl-tRNA synthetase
VYEAVLEPTAMTPPGMPSSFTPLHAAAAEAVAAHAGVPARELKVEATPRAELGDLAVGCFAIAKATKQNPAAVAQAIAAAFQPNEWLASATAAGPFVNFRANRAATFGWLAQHQLVPSELGKGQTIVIDYSSPNVSKHLAYHHIRSTMIGHALVQIFRALGYTVVGINHLGDWGTTHGKLLAAYEMWGAEYAAPLDVAKLNELYVRFSAAEKTDAAIKERGRAAFKQLEDGDPQLRALWERFREVSLAEYDEVYKLLGVTFDVVKGESEYLADVPGVLADLAAKQLSSASEGALVVALPGEKVPLMLRKDDGATTYATRDIPSAKFRWDAWHFARSLYVVDRGQSLHFKQLFKTLELMGYDWAARCEHVPFGLVTIGGAKGSTKAGNVVLLKDVVAEADGRVRALLAEINPELQGDVLDRVAHQVGVGAIVFANLASQRDKDVAFEWDRVIALQGDSGPYVQYNHARCASIMRKAPPRSGNPIDFAKLGHDAEWAVARKLLEFPSVIVAATPKCEPHVICHYLLELAGEFARWYTAGNGDASLRVLADDAATREARLALVASVQAVLGQGLALLGLAAPEQM